VNVKTIQSPQAPTAIGPYSQAVIANGFLFTAGQIALEPTTGSLIGGGVVEQTERVLANLSAILAAAGVSWDDVVKTTVFLRSMADFPKMNEVYAQRLGNARPARSTVEVSGLPRDVLVEIDAVAVLRT
jgi:2-iminobutanoate/2-iminopropanoate deaminase